MASGREGAIIQEGDASPITVMYRNIFEADADTENVVRGRLDAVSRLLLRPGMRFIDSSVSYSVVFTLHVPGQLPFFVGSGSLAHVFHISERAHKGEGLENAETPLFRRIRSEWAKGRSVTTTLHGFFADRQDAYRLEGQLVAELERHTTLLNSSFTPRGRRQYKSRPSQVGPQTAPQLQASASSERERSKNEYALWRLMVGNRTVYVGFDTADAITKYERFVAASQVDGVTADSDTYPRGYDQNNPSLQSRFSFLWAMLCLGQHRYGKSARVVVETPFMPAAEGKARYKAAIAAHYSPYLANQAHAKTFIQRARLGELLSRDQPLDFDTAS